MMKPSTCAPLSLDGRRRFVHLWPQQMPKYGDDTASSDFIRLRFDLFKGASYKQAN